MFQEEIFASSFAAAAYLKFIDFPKDKKVYRAEIYASYSKIAIVEGWKASSCILTRKISKSPYFSTVSCPYIFSSKIRIISFCF